MASRLSWSTCASSSEELTDTSDANLAHELMDASDSSSKSRMWTSMGSQGSQDSKISTDSESVSMDDTTLLKHLGRSRAVADATAQLARMASPSDICKVVETCIEKFWDSAVAAELCLTPDYAPVPANTAAQHELYTSGASVLLCRKLGVEATAPGRSTLFGDSTWELLREQLSDEAWKVRNLEDHDAMQLCLSSSACVADRRRKSTEAGVDQDGWRFKESVQPEKDENAGVEPAPCARLFVPLEGHDGCVGLIHFAAWEADEFSDQKQDAFMPLALALGAQLSTLRLQRKLDSERRRYKAAAVDYRTMLEDMLPAHVLDELAKARPPSRSSPLAKRDSTVSWRSSCSSVSDSNSDDSSLTLTAGASSPSPSGLDRAADRFPTCDSLNRAETPRSTGRAVTCDLLGNATTPLSLGGGGSPSSPDFSLQSVTPQRGLCISRRSRSGGIATIDCLPSTERSKSSSKRRPHSGHITERLSKLAYAEYHDCVAIIFTDIKGFTALSADLEPEDIVVMLDELYGRFDDIIHAFGPLAYKVETIGDSYMVAIGLLEELDRGTTAATAVEVAARLIKEATAVQVTTKEGCTMNLQIRAGISIGQIISGIVGKKMPRYCMFGDTVNTGSRMESTGEPGMIHTTAALRDACLESEMGENFNFRATGGMKIKGKGVMETYFVDPEEVLGPW